MRVAIITGASSGLGREFARQLARPGMYDEIWLIARREERLRAVARELPLPWRVLPLDLTKPESLQRLEQLLEREKPAVRMLVNAAGFGKMGDYREVSRQDSDDMIALNCQAAVDVTLCCLPYLQRGGRILQLCSTAGFQPLPSLAVYAASKAFLLRYSRALRWELFDRGIGVTAVCPYWVKDTEFISIARHSGNSRAIRHFPLASRSQEVVRRALRDSRLGLAVSTPGLVCTVHRALCKVAPDGVLIAGWELLRRL